MLQLILDEKECTDCGRCEVFLPDVLERLESNPISINLKNPNVNKTAINGALKSCQIGALSLIDSDGNSLSRI